MGGFGTGFLEGLSNTAREKLNEKHQQEQKAKDAERSTYERIWLDTRLPEDGGPTQEERDYAQSQLTKRSGKETKTGIQRIGDIFFKIRGGGKAKELPQQQPQQRTPQAPQQGGFTENMPNGQPAPGTAGAGPKLPFPPSPAPSQTQAQDPNAPSQVPYQNLPMPATSATADTAAQKMPMPAQRGKLPIPSTPAPSPSGIAGIPMMTVEQRRQMMENLTEAKKQKLKDAGKKGGLSDEEATEYSETGKWPAHAKRVVDKGVARPGTDPETGKPYTGTWDHFKETDGTDVWAKRDDKKVNTQLEWFKFPGDKPEDQPHAVRVDPRDPTKQLDASTGKQIPEGSTQINPNVILAQIRQRSYGKFGELYRALIGQGYSQAEADRIAGEQIEADFQRRESLLGAGSIHEALGQDAAGNAIAIPVATKKLPNPIAPIPSPQQPQPATPPQPGPPQATATPQSNAPQPQKAPSLPKPAPGPAAQRMGLSPRMLPGVSQAAASRAATFGVPITEVVTQLWDAPNSLSSYASLADNKDSQQRIGKAIELTLSGFGDSIGGASIGGGAGSVHLSSGGFGQWLQNALGVPGAIADQKAQALRDTMKEMTPQEREAYDATMSEMSVMAGLRSLNKSSSALGSIKIIERELPKIGVNVADSRQFNDQLKRVASAIKNAINTPNIFPKVRDPKTGEQVPVGISADMYKRINEIAGDDKPKGKLPSPGDFPNAPRVGTIKDGYKYKGGDPSKEENWEKVKK